MVMLIDDDKDDCDIFCDAAKMVSECRCQCIHNPADALTILNKSKTLPQCIFLDINMPVMDGFALLRLIKDDPRFADIPVVMYSTTPNLHEEKKSIQLGADRFIRKTSDYKKLVNLLKEVKTELVDPRSGNHS